VGDLDLNWYVARATAGRFFRTVFRLRIAGVANLPPTGTGAVIASNHVSVLDPIVIATAACMNGRQLRYFSLAEGFDKRFVGFGLRYLHQIPFVRGSGDREALDRMARETKEGWLTGIFPEGRMNDSEELLSGHSGAALWGTNKRFPPTGLNYRAPIRPTVSVVFGHPISTEAVTTSPRALKKVTDQMMSDILTLRTHARTEHP
jgi:1-acyl-sn-glycerol-3-phosphate acyltransferase